MQKRCTLTTISHADVCGHTMYDAVPNGKKPAVK
jgi:hypothetical protein